MKKWLLLIGILVVALLVIGMLVARTAAKPSSPVAIDTLPPTTADCRNFQEARVIIADTTLTVAVADNKEERTLGLGGCTALPDHAGMYFPYPELQLARYWMKGMVIPIDIIWVAGGRVIGTAESVPIPREGEKTLPIYQAPEPVDAVLEIAAGKAREYNISVGSTLEYQL